MPSPFTPTGPLLSFARLLGFAAAALVVLLYAVMLFSNPYNTDGITSGTSIVAAIMILLALLAAWGALTTRPVLLLLACLGSLVPVGAYLLGTPGVFALIGVANLGYGVAGAIMFLYPRGRAEGLGNTRKTSHRAVSPEHHVCQFRLPGYAARLAHFYRWNATEVISTASSSSSRAPSPQRPTSTSHRETIPRSNRSPLRSHHPTRPCSTRSGPQLTSSVRVPSIPSA
jgi:hypothetical protein